MDKKSKTIFQLDSPFTAVQWPQISSQNQVTILELLCSLLSPIGQYRVSHINLSKGKRSKKRKRREATEEASTFIPPCPQISSFVTIGLSSITRSLQNSSGRSRPNNAPIEGSNGGESVPAEEKSNKSTVAKRVTPNGANSPSPEGHFSAIFVCRSSQPAILNDHLPQLVTTASLAHPGLPATRLVELPKGSDARLSDALGLPRVSFIGIIEDAPQSKSLVDLVRECVPEVEIPWLQQAKESKYLPVKINAIEKFSTVMKND